MYTQSPQFYHGSPSYYPQPAMNYFPQQPFSPVIYSNRRLEHINCVIPESAQKGGLFIGDTVATLKQQILIENNIKAILCCNAQACKNINNIKVPVDFKYLQLQDHIHFPIREYFQQAIQFIDSKIKNKKNILVQCHGGVSRSATMICAYLIKNYQWSPEQAFAFLKQKRHRIKPNQGFWQQLEQYWRTINQNKKISNENNFKTPKKNKQQPTSPNKNRSYLSPQRIRSEVPNKNLKTAQSQKYQNAHNLNSLKSYKSGNISNEKSQRYAQKQKKQQINKMDIPKNQNNADNIFFTQRKKKVDEIKNKQINFSSERKPQVNQNYQTPAKSENATLQSPLKMQVDIDPKIEKTIKQQQNAQLVINKQRMARNTEAFNTPQKLQTKIDKNFRQSLPVQTAGSINDLQKQILNSAKYKQMGEIIEPTKNGQTHRQQVIRKQYSFGNNQFIKHKVNATQVENPTNSPNTINGYAQNRIPHQLRQHPQPNRIQSKLASPIGQNVYNPINPHLYHHLTHTYVQPNNYYQPNVFALSTVHGTYQPNISGDSYPNAYAYNNVYYSKPIPYQNGAPVQYLAREEYGQGYSHVPRPQLYNNQQQYSQQLIYERYNSPPRIAKTGSNTSNPLSRSRGY